LKIGSTFEVKEVFKEGLTRVIWCTKKEVEDNDAEMDGALKM
jgi:hypothetical protein